MAAIKSESLIGIIRQMTVIKYLNETDRHKRADDLLVQTVRLFVSGKVDMQHVSTIPNTNRIIELYNSFEKKYGDESYFEGGN